MERVTEVFMRIMRKEHIKTNSTREETSRRCEWAPSQPQRVIKALQSRARCASDKCRWMRF